MPTVEAIAGVAQMNVIEFHTWNARSGNIERPDRIVFDLDPGEGVAWQRVQEAAVLTRSSCRTWGCRPGSRPAAARACMSWCPSPALRLVRGERLLAGRVQHLARVVPSRFVARSGPANRVGKIFVDYLRNRRGATTVAAYSARARPGLGVSMPVTWDALDAVKSSAQWTIANAREHLSFQSEDPWPVLELPAAAVGGDQALEDGIARLGFHRSCRTAPISRRQAPGYAAPRATPVPAAFWENIHALDPSPPSA